MGATRFQWNPVAPNVAPSCAPGCQETRLSLNRLKIDETASIYTGSGMLLDESG